LEGRLAGSKFGAITLKQIRAFSAVAELGSFSLAAQKLHLSQPAITAGIKIMEEQLGARLLERTSRGVAVTEAGRLLLDSAVPILNQLELCFDSIRNHDVQPYNARIALGCLPSIAENILPQAIAAFVELHPHVSVDLKVAVSTQVEKLLLDGLIDLGIAMAPQLGGIDQTSFHDEPIYLFCRRDDPLCHDQVEWRQLKGRVVLNMGFDRHIKAAVNAIPHAEIQWAPTEYAIRNSRTIVALLQRGDLAVLPKWAVSVEQFPEIARIPIVDPVLVRKLYVLRRPGTTGTYDEDLIEQIRRAMGIARSEPVAI
jgi:DNA-binding transcriptional LysR family regulator